MPSGMVYTTRNSYVPLRTAEVTVAEVPLDSTTPGGTLWDMTSRDVYEMVVEDNNVSIYFAGEMTDNAVSTAHIWGKSVGTNDPAEKIAEVSLGSGSAVFKGRLPGSAPGVTIDSSTYLMVDGLVLDPTDSFHVRDVSVSDVSTNRAAKLSFNVAGLKFLLVEFTKVAGANFPTRITPYARFW